ncbi:alpha/beta fold hydrolase [Streptomyces sp. NPDC059909]|uniref:alpha/beta fold hydrolase n=1 Tax=Streptomyces sp. NPDC059909 TaxID=3346998 RepID=UPI0036590640
MDTFSYHGNDGCALHAATLGTGPALILLHDGGPDHHSLVPLARRLAESYTVVLPDVRGYGRSVCTDPARHTWAQYADDVTALLGHLGLGTAALGGTGLGGTITLRTAAKHPQHIRAAVVIDVDDIEDAVKEPETAMMENFAARVMQEGIDAAWKAVLPDLAPVIRNLVRDAMTRSDPASIAAACAIGRDRAFTSVADLASIPVPTLVVPGSDEPEPAASAEEIARALPHGHLAKVSLSGEMRTADDLAQTMAPAMWAFLASHHLTVQTCRRTVPRRTGAPVRTPVGTPAGTRVALVR